MSTKANKTAFLNKLADLMEEHGVLCFDTRDEGSYTPPELTVEFNDNTEVSVNLYAYPSSLREAAGSLS